MARILRIGPVCRYARLCRGVRSSTWTSRNAPGYAPPPHSWRSSGCQVEEVPDIVLRREDPDGREEEVRRCEAPGAEEDARAARGHEAHPRVPVGKARPDR